MATLKIQLPGDGTKIYRIHKKLTSLGRSDDADVPSARPASLSDSPAHIHFDGREFNLSADRSRGRDLASTAASAPSTAWRTRIGMRIGSVELGFSLYDQPATDEPAASDATTELDVLHEAVRVQRQADVQLRAAGAARPAAGRGHPGVQRRQGIPGADGVGRAGGQGGAQPAPRDHRGRRQPAVGLDPGARREDAAAAHHLGRAERRGVPELAVGGEPQADLGDVRAAARARRTCWASSTSATTASPSCSSQSHLEVLTVFAAQASLLVRNALLVNELQLDNRSLQEQLEQMRFGEIIGSSPRMQEVFRKVQKVATTDISVLITGETGTGKELIARELHTPLEPRQAARSSPSTAAPSPRTCSRPSCSATSRARSPARSPTSRASSRRPTAARCSSTRSARCRSALQVKILRALQERVVVRVGDTQPETGRHPHRRRDQPRPRGGDEGRPLPRGSLLPPQRREPPPAAAARARRRRGRARALHGGRDMRPSTAGRSEGFTPNAIAAIKRHRWPGNIRQLENRIKKAVVLSDEALLGPEDLELSPDDLPPILPLAEAKEEFQREYINEVLDAEQRQPHQDGARPGRRPAHHLPPPREGRRAGYSGRRQRARRVGRVRQALISDRNVRVAVASPAASAAARAAFDAWHVCC